MPNYVTNVIEMEGDEQEIEELMEAVREDDKEIGTIDFNKIIPMPESLNIEAGSRTYDGLKAYKKYISELLLENKCRTVSELPEIPAEKEDQYARDTHQAIVEREKFENVQTLLEARQKKYSKSEKQKKYPLTSRIQCLECGSYFHRRNFKGTIKWACSKHFRDCRACNSNYYTEERIYDGFVAMVNKLRFGEEKILPRVIDKLQEAAMCMKKQNQAAMELSRKIAELTSKLQMLDQLHAKNYLAVEVYQSQSMEIKNSLAALKAERHDTFESRIVEMLEQVRELQKYLEPIQNPLETFDEDLFKKIIVSITINNRDEMVMTVLGGLKFKEII